MRRICVGVLVLVLGTAGCSQPPPDPIADFVSSTLPEGTGGTVVVARGDRMIHCAGFGMADRAAQIPATCDTVYDTMSITKQFTAAAVLKLEMMGRLRVRAPISTYLGPVPADKRGITVHHLLTHTSGMVDAIGDDYQVQSRQDMLTGALAAKLRSRPGAKFHYSNVGYSLLAAIVEKASGLGYERFLATELFTPAGMTSTGYVLPRWQRRQLAVEYDAGGKSQGKPDEHPWASDGPHWNLRGNGGILSTARDMFRWHRALTADTILSASARKRLFTAHTPTPDPDLSYGYGWGIRDANGERVAWHNGGNSWSLASFARSLDDSPRDAVMTFWVSNQVSQESGWNLEDLELDLTDGLLDRGRISPRGRRSAGCRCRSGRGAG